MTATIGELFGPLPMRDDYRRWFEERATVFTDVDSEASSRLARLCKMQQCYANCARNEFGGLDYYEGLVMVPSLGIPIDHAFLVRGTRVVDPTLAIGDRIERGTAWAGIRIKNALRRAADSAGRKFGPLLWREYSDGFPHE